MHMADTKALFTQRFDAARAALTAGDDIAAAESLHSAIVVARTDPALRRELASALFHLGKLSRKFGRAGEAEAESLLTEALEISEALFGWEHVALAPLLNELSRLHVQRSQHARAEEVLERLLAIARGKSDENADVATALAGLAVVKRKLDDDAAAETLYRDALRIREKVLEPGHMVTVVTLEQLSETCAARGNFAEALALLRRALTTREVALGPGHATVQSARSRMAELELQLAVAVDTATAAAAKAGRGAIATPAWFKRVESPADMPSTAVPSPVNSKKMEFLGEPEPRAPRPAPLSRERAKTPAFTSAVAAASLMASSLHTPAASQIIISPPESARPSESVADRDAVIPYREAVVADVALSGLASDDASLHDNASEIAQVHADSPAPARKKRTVLYASVGVAAVAIAGLLLMMRVPAGSGSDPVSTQANAAPHTPAVGAPVVSAPPTSAGAAAIGAAAVVGATRADSLRTESPKSAPAAAAVPPDQRAEGSVTPELRLPRVEVHVAPIDIPNVPVPSVATATNFDSIVRSAPDRKRAPDADRSGTGDKVSPTASAEVDYAITPAKLIGRVPEPRFPEALIRAGRREGQVLVRFMVNEVGSVDVATMIVERSDDELFTEAVRDILPRFRFEPARRTGPESKPVSAWVSVPFRFTTKKK
jgi:TonB family protein